MMRSQSEGVALEREHKSWVFLKGRIQKVINSGHED
jgi:hypothetical protein